ncbi:ribonuclease P protein component [Chryseobacterium koreense]|uniref:Ribonuclease P protein component n=1 Tax=Chryseobacterium koreense CCUG 49689 TaxID=1304281 RepID=A0A0J7LSV0_9FLAO|nr:ribonuclease P protein component [Chryseobacterium koreense]KMQ72035.1 ribonuclease P [Chryseobacterium koreense CCUG 49689]
MNQKYPKKEKLKKKSEIDLLFAKGKWHSCGNLRIISMNLEQKPQENFELKNQKVGVSVSKKYFKKAVDRNRIKRLLRESYRLNKSIFIPKFGTQSISMLFWVSKEIPRHYSEVEQEFVKLCESKK